MASEIQLLQLSPTMSEGTIVKWHVKVGDKISAGDTLAEIETDKAVMEQEAFDDAVVLKILVEEGSAVPVGGQIMIVGEEGESADSVPAAAEASKKEEAKKETAKEETPAAASNGSSTAPKKAEAPAAASSGGRTFASPLARKIAEDNGLDVSAIAGSGPNNRVIKRDVERALQDGTGKASSASPSLVAPTASAPQEGTYNEEIPVSGMRKVIARRLVESRQFVPSFSLNMDVDAAPILNAVKRVREINPDDKVTVTHFIIKAMASTLQRHPWLRTQWVNDKMLRMDASHISVAVAVEDGLLTPIIRNADRKGVSVIARELRELAGKARDRKLTEEDLSGGTQTLSNLGMFGVDSFDAIINPPESSILAIGQVMEKPVVRKGEMVIGKVMTLNLSSDHRVVDGAVAASYLKDLKAALEEPLLMLV